jgi:transcriptional regulator with XRE-family HTH domain
MLTATAQPATFAVAVNDRDFYRRLGQRIAERRRALGMNQTELAERFAVSQQTMANYESGKLRVAVEMLPLLSDTLGITIEELIGREPTPTKRAGKRGPAPKIQQQLERVSALPKAKQRVIVQVLDSMLAQAGR